MALAVDLVLAAVAGILLVLLSTIETAYGQISDVSRHILRGGRAEGREVFFAELMDQPERFRIALLIGVHSTVIALALLSLRAAVAMHVGHSITLGFVIAFAIVFVSRLLLPVLIAQNAPERVLLGLMPLFKPYYRVVQIVAAPLAAFLNRFRKEEPEEEESEDQSFDETMSDIQALIDVAEEEGIIEEAEGAMIQSIVELGDTSVHEIMTPRMHIVAVEATATVLEARNLMVASKHSRLPVYSDQIDNIEGVLYVRDLLAAWSDGRENETVTTVMRSAYFVPEIKPVADLLEEMRKSQVQIALVIDEYGAVAGLITIEDLLEEIVGEIEDEDVEISEQDEIIHGLDGSLVVKGSTEIRKIELQLDTELEADDFTTVAGLIINELGHLPTRGERLEFRGVEFEVLEADHRRVNLVRLRPLVPPESDQSQEAAQQG